MRGSRDLGRALGQTWLFADAPSDLLEAVGERSTWRRYRRGGVVFVQGEFGDRFYAILSGTVKIAAYHQDGREAVLALLGPGDVFGELSLFDGEPRSADAVVVEDAELLSIGTQALEELIRERPELASLLLGVLARRLRRTSEALQDAGFFDVVGRLARRLASLADERGRRTERGIVLDLPLPQEGLANMVGATRESVNKALRSLERSGLIQRDGRRYVVPDVEELRERAR